MTDSPPIETEGPRIKACGRGYGNKHLFKLQSVSKVSIVPLRSKNSGSQPRSLPERAQLRVCGERVQAQTQCVSHLVCQPPAGSIAAANGGFTHTRGA